MKTQVKNLLVTISKNELELLTKEVKETVATYLPVAKAKTVFTAADFWNVQRRKSQRTGRRLFM